MSDKSKARRAASRDNTATRALQIERLMIGHPLEAAIAMVAIRHLHQETRAAIEECLINIEEQGPFADRRAIGEAISRLVNAARADNA